MLFHTYIVVRTNSVAVLAEAKSENQHKAHISRHHIQKAPGSGIHELREKMIFLSF